MGQEVNSSSASILTKFIKTRALEFGFSKVGVVRAEVMLEEGMRLREWLARGFHGTMEWVERSRDQQLRRNRVRQAGEEAVDGFRFRFIR